MSLKINHDLKLVFLHIPKNGGVFITNALINNYNFEVYENFINLKENAINIILERKKNRCINLIEFGYKYLLYQDILHYKFFCVIRNPYERFVSGFLYMQTYKDGILNLKDCILNIENYKKGNVNNICRDLETYSHIFLTQYHFIQNIPNIVILQFENLNDNLCDFLLENGIKEINHELKPVNYSSYQAKKFWEYYDVYCLDFVNKLFDEDFKRFGFQKYTNIFDFYYHMIKKYNTYKKY